MLENQIPSIPVLIEDLGMLFPTDTSRNKARHGMFKCQCGNEFKAQTQRVKHGYTKSCGCYHKSIVSEAKTTHGLVSHRLYQTWKAMIARTTNHKCKAYDSYGGRGITVCQRWHDVANFIEDMYPSYQEGLSIDRIDNNKGYSKENCRWTTKSVQTRNTRTLKSNNTSGYRGVYFNKNASKWMSRVSINSKLVYLGYFDTATEAAIVYDRYIIDNKLEHTINGVKE